MELWSYKKTPNIFPVSLDWEQSSISPDFTLKSSQGVEDFENYFVRCQNIDKKNGNYFQSETIYLRIINLHSCNTTFLSVKTTYNTAEHLLIFPQWTLMRGGGTGKSLSPSPVSLLPPPLLPPPFLPPHFSLPFSPSPFSPLSHPPFSCTPAPAPTPTYPAPLYIK